MLLHSALSHKLNHPLPHCEHEAHDGVTHAVEQHLAVSDAEMVFPGHIFSGRQVNPFCAAHVWVSPILKLIMKSSVLAFPAVSWHLT